MPTLSDKKLSAELVEGKWLAKNTAGVCRCALDTGDRIKLDWTAIGNCLCYKVYYSGDDHNQSLRTVSKNQVLLDNLKPEKKYKVEIACVTDKTNLKEETIYHGTLLLKQVSNAQDILQDACALEIRVGNIISCQKHPNADALFVEEVDIGESAPRTIISGLVKYFVPEQLINRKVLVLCNLKERKMRGIESKGMLLCGSTKDKSQVEPLCPPENTPIGELVYFEGCEMTPTKSGNRATKSFERVVPFMKTNEKGLAFLQNSLWMTSNGACYCSIIDGNIS
eukprot:jgi/Galph1/4478/GphlegSOOS_G3199.1